MSKDPAVLFYTSDFLTGTFTMTNEQAGKYIRLLCLQHQKGLLTEKDMFNVCGTYDEQVFLKFEKEGEFFFNRRMKEEAERRKNFCESRSKSRQGSKNQNNKPKNIRKTYVERTETENETITEAENVFENWDLEKMNFFNGWKWKEKFCSDKNILMPDLEKRMTEFINDIELKEDYKSVKDLRSHFTNTFNKQKNGNAITSTSNKHKGAMQLVASLKQDFANRRKENPGT